MRVWRDRLRDRGLERAAARGRAWSDGFPVAARILGLLLLLTLAACGGSLKGIFESGQQEPAPTPRLPVAGGVKVALILPLTGPGETARIGLAMKQAAEMALFDSGTPGITLITKDSAGSASGAQAAARAALAEGAELILGPLLANEVQAVSPLARAQNVPVVAFSSVSATDALAVTIGAAVTILTVMPKAPPGSISRAATSGFSVRSRLNWTPLRREV